MIPTEYNLNIGAPARLRALRKACGADWRNARQWGFNSWRAAYCYGINQCAKEWYSHDPAPLFRNETQHDTEWYTDVHCDATARGIVGGLSHGRFIAGYTWSENGERVYFPEIFTDADDALRMSDEHARVFAESACEDSARFNAAQELEYKIEQKMDRLRECLALRNNPCFAKLRRECSNLIETIRDARETLETEYKGVL